MWFLIAILSVSVALVVWLAVWKIKERMNRVSITRDFFNKSKFRIEHKVENEETVYVYNRGVCGHVATFIYVNEERISKDKIKGDIDEMMDAQIADLASGEIEVYKNGKFCDTKTKRVRK